MSFLHNVKNEILYNEVKETDAVVAEIHGLLNQNFKIHVSKNISLTIIKDNSFLIKRFSFLVEKYLDEKFEIKVIKNLSIKKPYTYIIHFPDAQRFLTKIKMLKDNTFVFNSKDVLNTRATKTAYLKGEFLHLGTFSDPNKNYHLEFRKNDKSSAEKLKNILNSFALHSKITTRKSYFIVYIKEADKISDFLKLIGAYNSVLELENLMVLKYMANNVNRMVNCETANLNKTISASFKQINDINYIFENVGREHLSNELKTLADLRVEYPDLSLVEIGNLCNPPISKSSVNYKLKKISKIASNLRGE